MGNNSAKQKQSEIIIQQKLNEQALKNFDLRVKSYSYAYHGPYYQYIEFCRAQYELECIPECCRYGPNYDPRNHNYDY
jgi:hypothetical protein